MAQADVGLVEEVFCVCQSMGPPVLPPAAQSLTWMLSNSLSLFSRFSVLESANSLQPAEASAPFLSTNNRQVAQTHFFLRSAEAGEYTAVYTIGPSTGPLPASSMPKMHGCCVQLTELRSLSSTLVPPTHEYSARWLLLAAHSLVMLATEGQAGLESAVWRRPCIQTHWSTAMTNGFCHLTCRVRHLLTPNVAQPRAALTWPFSNAQPGSWKGGWIGPALSVGHDGPQPCRVRAYAPPSPNAPPIAAPA